jgi:DtxR family transcriptional regulator, Mn-dependent transcriptional regulator
VTDLIDTTEMYLRTIFELEEEGVPVLRARIAERLGQSGPTVSETVARMERDGLLSVLPNRSLELSAEGRTRAVRVMRKHRLAERLLLDVIGLEFEYVHSEACRWEHVMSERVERKIVALLHQVSDSPYGNPIPGLAELGLPEQEVVRAGLAPLTALTGVEPCLVVVRRLGEPLQQDPVAMAHLTAAGIKPGERVSVTREDGGWRVARVGAAAAVTGDAAQNGAVRDVVGSVLITPASAPYVLVSMPR